MHRGDRDLNDDDQQVVGGVEVVEVVVVVQVVGVGGEPAYGSQSLIADKNLRKSLQEGFAQWIN